MQKEVFNRLEAEGYRVSIVSVDHLTELKDEINGLYDSSLIGNDLKAMLTKRFRFDLPEKESPFRSILCIVLSSPIGSVVSHYQGGRMETSIPPTYRDYSRLPPVMEQKLKVILGEYGWSVEFNRNLPLKLLAARSGLTEYGRNNIAYAKGLGSFAFLSAYYTDMPCEIDTWGEARRMALCDSCTKCVDNCPTGAIRADKRIIDGERCLTMHNEADSPVPFPDWITPSAHNSLVGCLACQIACPMNAKQLNNSAGVVEFDEAETELILGNTPPGILAKAMTEKLEFHGIDTYYEVLARNLKALFDKGLK